MTKSEYNQIQRDLDYLLENPYGKYSQMMDSKYKERYRQAVLACKSVLSNYKPSEKLAPLFCYECGITETQPSFMQKFCRYCGAKLESEEIDDTKFR